MQAFQNIVQNSSVSGGFISLLVPKQSLSEPCLNSAPVCGVWWSPPGLIPTLCLLLARTSASLQPTGCVQFFYLLVQDYYFFFYMILKSWSLIFFFFPINAWETSWQH